jgi:uncharacterized protein YdeI (YjbR/CyaY-like superfamily)
MSNKRKRSSTSSTASTTSTSKSHKSSTSSTTTSKLVCEEFYPKTQAEWRSWLEKNHVERDNVWLIMYKKSSGKRNVSWSEAVDTALCFGWIDSVKKSIDDEKSKQYFSKRRAKSNWSLVNKRKIDELTAAGRMTPAGIASVNLAKQNGSWTLLDAVDRLEMPPELDAAFKQQPPTALQYFTNLSKSMRKQMLYWVISAKRAETKAKRVKEIVDNAANGQRPKHFK